MFGLGDVLVNSLSSFIKYDVAAIKETRILMVTKMRGIDREAAESRM